MKKIEIITTPSHFEDFVNREDIDVLSIDVKACEENVLTQYGFTAAVVYNISKENAELYEKRLRDIKERIEKQRSDDGLPF